MNPGFVALPNGHLHFVSAGRPTYRRNAPLGLSTKLHLELTRAALLAKLNINPEPTRYYCFESGDGFETAGLDEDPDGALMAVRPSPKLPLRGVPLEVSGKARAREVLQEQGDELPWRDLASSLRDDLTLDSDWHGALLTTPEKLMLQKQRMESASAKRKARLKLVAKMKRDADRLELEQL